MTISKSLVPALCVLLIAGCGDDDLSKESYAPPLEYEFTSRLNDSSSSVSNEKAVTQELLIYELFEYLESAQAKTLLEINLNKRIDKILNEGTFVSSAEDDSSLANYNVYTGEEGEPTPISIVSDTNLPLVQESFVDLTESVNISDLLVDTSRKLLYTTLIDVDGTSTLAGDFIGLSAFTDGVDGNGVVLSQLRDWLSTRATAIADGIDTPYDNDGVYLELIGKELLRGAINYSLLAQYNLVSTKGLLQQNSTPVNLAEVVFQNGNVSTGIAQLESASVDLYVQELELSVLLDNWKLLDPDADPAEPKDTYQENYAHTTTANKYYDKAALVNTASEFKDTAIERLDTLISMVDELLPYTSLGKTWDESFGLFGASRFYGLYSDAEIVSKSDYDRNGDSHIDVFTERNFGYAVMASHRDAGAELKNTDFSGNIWNAFLMGRQIIQQNHGYKPEVDVNYHTDLKEQADIVLENLEKVIAATIIHHLNLAIASLSEVDSLSSFDKQYYKDWSQLKGLTLSLQFNDRPIISKADLLELHKLIKDTPIKDVDNYRTAHISDLGEARDIIRDAYGFADANASRW